MSRRQRNSWLEWIPWRLATSDTRAPVASTSSSIACFCSLLHRRRVVATMSNCGDVVLGPDIVLSSLQLVTTGANRGHLPQPTQGVLHRARILPLAQSAEKDL